MDRLDQVLSQVKDEYSPDAAAKQRIRTQLATALVAGGVASATQLAGNAAAHGASATGALGNAAGLGSAGLQGAAAKASGWLWFKAVTGVGLLAGLSATSVHLVRSQWHDSERVQAQQLEPQQQEPQQLQPRQLEAQPLEPQRLEAPFEAAHAALPAAASAEPLSDSNLQPTAAAAEPSHVAVALPNSKHHTPQPAPAARSSMLEEFSLLRQASQALRAGNTDEARRTLQEHKRRFPASSLGPERNGLELLTSCSSGANGSSRARAEHFLASSPSSPMAEAIPKQCLK